MPSPNSVTIVIPALNEEEKLEWSVRTTVAAADRWFDQWEILIFDDGSTDRTAAIADSLAREFPAVRAIHNAKPSGLGGVLKQGLDLAQMTYFFWVDGKGATAPEALDEVFARREQADLVVLYAINQAERPLRRRVISVAFRVALNALFALRLQQHTHPTLCRTAQARQIAVRTDSHAFQAELLIKMIKQGATYVEVGVRDDFSRQHQHSKAFHPSNVVGVGLFFLGIAWDVHVKRRYRRR